MSSLFDDLYPYRQRQNRDPLEDWLTECLAATIRALPASAQAALLGEWAGFPVASDSLTGLQIETQYQAGTAGRPDMLLLLGKQPWIVIENKVGHGIAARDADGPGGPDAADEPAHQLSAYAHWLAGHGVDGALPQAVVFITHLTPPPADFADRDGAAYRGLHRHATSWGAVARRILALTGDLPPTHHAAALASAFMTCLETNDMSNEFPSSTAFAAAELYLAQAGPLENLVDQMWREFQGVAHAGKTASYQLTAQPTYGAIAAMRYVAPGPNSPSKSSYLETGIWFPQLKQWFDEIDLPVETNGTQVYVCLANSDEAFEAITQTPEGFVRASGDFIAVHPLAAFPADPQRRGEAIVAWVAERAGVLRAFLVEYGLVT